MEEALTIDMTEVGPYFLRLLKQSRSIPYRKFAVLMIRSCQRNFREQGRPEKWAPLSPKTLAARKSGGKKGKGRGRARILVDTGLMQKYIEPEFYDEGDAKVVKVEARRQTDDGAPLALFHQYGTGVHGPLHRAFRQSRKVVAPRARGKDWEWDHPGEARPMKNKFWFNKGVPARPFVLWQTEDQELMVKMVRDHLDGGE